MHHLPALVWSPKEVFHLLLLRPCPSRIQFILSSRIIAVRDDVPQARAPGAGKTRNGLSVSKLSPIIVCKLRKSQQPAEGLVGLDF